MLRIRTAVGLGLVLMALVGLHAQEGIKQPPPGFTALFNGKDLSGWQNAGKQAQFWKVENGVLHYVGKGGSNLVTEKKFRDFELYVDWKIEKGGDSGIYLRGQPQVQIWDNKEGSGGLWNNPPGSPGKVPLVVADNPPGQWNTFHIIMKGDRVTVYLNGKKVVDNAVFQPGGKPAASEGPIHLQIHGSPLWFRNIFIKEL
ncbi:hypothetical protein HRbin36_02336 [bacterium HR36]|nr:hypothetical protein HRbin36_02336 [bacterium HR36]